MTLCEGDTAYTNLAYKAGGPKMVIAYQPIVIFFFTLLYCLLLRLLFLERCPIKFLRRSYAILTCIAITFVVHWWFEKPMMMNAFHYTLGASFLAVLCMAYLNHNCTTSMKVMSKNREGIAGMASVFVTVVCSHSVPIALGIMTERSIDLNPLVVILISNTFVVVAGRILMKLLSICEGLPDLFTTWLVIVLQLFCFTAQREYITGLQTLGKVSLVSGGQALFDICRHVIVCHMRKRRLQLKRKKGLVKGVDRIEMLLATDLITDISTEILSLIISMLRTLACDPRIFVVAIPYSSHNLQNEINSFLIQLVFEIATSVCIIGITIAVFKERKLPFHKTIGGKNLHSFLVIVCVTACAQFISIGWTVRWGCLSCKHRLDGYFCPLSCDS